MTEEKFFQRIQKGERSAVNHPRWYKFRILLFVFFGYAVIFGVFGTLMMLVLGISLTALLSSKLAIALFKKKLIFAILPAIWLLAKSLWVRFPKPQGYNLKRKAFPEIWKVVDELSKELKTPKVHTILLDHQFNAAVVQSPRLGILGWNKNYLIVGLQLLLSMPEAEMRSVIAHELGHLSGNHSRFAGWIYRVRLSWQKIVKSFKASDSAGTRMTRAFVRWYGPRFDAFTFALGRQNEYEADAVAAQLTSREVTGRALIHVHGAGPELMKQYWSNYKQKVETMPEPDHPPFSGLVTYLETEDVDFMDVFAWNVKALQKPSHYRDTHPSLGQRLTALNYNPDEFYYNKQSVARAWLGQEFAAVVKHFDQNWLDENLDAWRIRFEYLESCRQRIAELRARELETLSNAELWDYATKVFEIEGASTSEDLFAQYLVLQPHDPAAHHMLGRIAMERNDPSCLEHFKIALNKSDLILTTCEYAYAYCKSHDRLDEAEFWMSQAAERVAFEKAFKAERSSVTLNDGLTKPTISEELKACLAKVKATKHVGNLWVAEKVVEVAPEHPFYVVAFTTRGFPRSIKHLMQEVAKSCTFDGDVFFVVKADDYKPLANHIIRAGVKLKF